MTEWKLHHKIFVAAGALAAGAVIYAGVKADRMARIGAGYQAKIACSEIFVAGRNTASVLESEFAGMDPAMELITVKVDEDLKRVRASAPLGLGGARAFYREGYGCTLANAGRVAPLPEPVAPIEPTAWEEAPPVSGKAIERIDYGALDFALTRAFENNEPNHRSVLVVVDGKIVDERYADGFDRATPFLSWSMGKSVTATMVGAAAMRGLLDINEPAPVPEWAGDAEKSAITWNDLLRMQSGLAFGEHYDQIRSDVNQMLFERADAGGFAARSPMEHAPGEEWYYSSGTTNLIVRTLRQVLAEQEIDFHAFAREAILDPIGATSVVLEPDASGTFIGSSFVYATARDWARLGQLYLQDGVWEGERLLPEGWADYVRSPTAASDGQYGAQFWLNNEGAERPRFFPGVPENMFFFAGHEGQYVFIIPDKRMVIVRTGMSRNLPEGQSAMKAVTPLVEAIYESVGMPHGTAM
ncbi:serine hydrolase [Hyphococcus flavus]|uniref:Serine hydrolase n=1 Tax=Hyphococcus flavus TaxID=1866326 RepID=A0AAF0CG98_9PROT|nr:serine hydrolase [Hyphococcus flavus]WDI32114.1 serine hydrolase [Hyphococcus flavus]